MDIKKRILGALLGFAIGDSMGATTEFMTTESIEKTYGKVENLIGGGWLNLDIGEVTDDTQMSMCVIDALMKFNGNKDDFKKDCMDNFIAWFQKKPKDIGGQCYRAIFDAHYYNKYPEKNEKSLGNGSLMRALPCALVSALCGGEYSELNEIQGRLTHNSDKCTKAIAEYQNMIEFYIKEESGEPTINLNDIYNADLNNAYVYDTYYSALVYVLMATNFKDGIIMAVNNGKDADTTAAITGGLLGAKFGVDSIPENWLKDLSKETKRKLTEFCEFLMEKINGKNN